MPLKVAIPAAALIVVLALMILAGVLLGPDKSPAHLSPTVAPTPTSQVYQELEDESLYFAGKCQIASLDAAPDWYAAHPGIPRCKFKTKPTATPSK